MTDRDYPTLLAMEREASDELQGNYDAWDFEEFKASKGKKLVAEYFEVVKRKQSYFIAGFVVFHAAKHHLRIAKLNVHPECRKKGVGRWMVWELAEQLTGERQVMYGDVLAGNLGAQKWLRAVGVPAVKTVFEKEKELIRFRVDMSEAAMRCG
jgi:ribosomal protein S18 acetylase RimI-like enzyme